MEDMGEIGIMRLHCQRIVVDGHAHLYPLYHLRPNGISPRAAELILNRNE